MTDKLAPQAPSQPRDHTEPFDDEDEDEQQELPQEVKIAQQIGEFDEVVVWGHGGSVDEESDMFVRGIREWIGFAEGMHCDEQGEEEVETQSNGTKAS